MELSEVAKYRLINQQINGTKIKTVSEMVAWFGAVQAQEYGPTKWGLGLRLPHLKDEDIEKDFTDGKILRTHLLRPTWHFVSAKDIRWILMLTAPRVNAANATMYRKFELDNGIFTRCNDILIKALQGGRQHTRDTLNEEFKKKKILAKGHRLSYIMMRAELDGIICSGAKQGNQFTYSLLEERVPAFNLKNRDEALAELTKRYFTSRGPATVKDLSTWSGLTLTDCRRGIELVKQYFIEKIIENETYYFPSEISLNNKQFQGIYLLPIYDELIMGYKNRAAILEFRNSIKPAPIFSYGNTIVFEGQIIGTWKRTIGKKSIELECEFFKLLNKSQIRLFERAIDRYSEFMSMPVNYILKDEQVVKIN